MEINATVTAQKAATRDDDGSGSGRLHQGTYETQGSASKISVGSHYVATVDIWVIFYRLISAEGNLFPILTSRPLCGLTHVDGASWFNRFP